MSQLFECARIKSKDGSDPFALLRAEKKYEQKKKQTNKKKDELKKELTEFLAKWKIPFKAEAILFNMAKNGSFDVHLDPVNFSAAFHVQPEEFMDTLDEQKSFGKPVLFWYGCKQDERAELLSVKPNNPGIPNFYEYELLVRVEGTDVAVNSEQHQILVNKFAVYKTAVDHKDLK